MTLSAEDITNLAWACTACDENASSHYDDDLVQRIAIMSEQRHRMLDYEVDWADMPKTVGEIDSEKNAAMLPETPQERAYAMQSILHRPLSYTLSDTETQSVGINTLGQLVFPR